jgi:hypothetical protein
VAIIACPECKKSISTEADVCPHCGAPTPRRVEEDRTKRLTESAKGLVGLAVTGVLVYFCWPLLSLILIHYGVLSPAPEAPPPTLASLPLAGDDLLTIITRTGCHSSYSDDKKHDIFVREYENHTVRVTGQIVHLDKSSLGLKIDRSTFTQDVMITLRDPDAGYNLQKDTVISVTFRLRRLGGCFMPFSGDLGEIVSSVKAAGATLLGSATPQQAGIPSAAQQSQPYTEAMQDKWCAQTTVPSNIAVCSDRELRALSLERKHAYDEAQARIDPRAQAALLEDQTSWGASYARACGISPNVAPTLPLERDPIRLNR